MGAVADLQDYVTDLGIVGESTDWPTSRRRVHDGTATVKVERLVVFTEDGGQKPETPADEGTQGDAAWRYPQVQVRVRGAPEEGDEAEEKAQEIYDAVHGKLGVTMGEHEYARVLALTDPIFIGFDSRLRPEHTFSVQMTRPVREPASL